MNSKYDVKLRDLISQLNFVTKEMRTSRVTYFACFIDQNSYFIHQT